MVKPLFFTVVVAKGNATDVYRLQSCHRRGLCLSSFKLTADARDRLHRSIQAAAVPKYFMVRCSGMVSIAAVYNSSSTSSRWAPQNVTSWYHSTIDIYRL